MSQNPYTCLCRIAYNDDGTQRAFIRAQHLVQEYEGGERVCILSIGRESQLPQQQSLEAAE